MLFDGEWTSREGILMHYESDFLVIGGGIAGLWFALKAAQTGKVTILTKRGLRESSTNLAQGGIAAVFSAEDSFEDHVTDTLLAGAGLCNEAIVNMVIKNGPSLIQKLVGTGVQFTPGKNSEVDAYDLGLEGGA